MLFHKRYGADRHHYGDPPRDGDDQCVQLELCARGDGLVRGRLDDHEFVEGKEGEEDGDAEKVEEHVGGGGLFRVAVGHAAAVR